MSSKLFKEPTQLQCLDFSCKSVTRFVGVRNAKYLFKMLKEMCEVFKNEDKCSRHCIFTASEMWNLLLLTSELTLLEAACASVQVSFLNLFFLRPHCHEGCFGLESENSTLYCKGPTSFLTHQWGARRLTHSHSCHSVSKAG